MPCSPSLSWGAPEILSRSSFGTVSGSRLQNALKHMFWIALFFLWSFTALLVFFGFPLVFYCSPFAVLWFSCCFTVCFLWLPSGVPLVFLMYSFRCSLGSPYAFLWFSIAFTMALFFDYPRFFLIFSFSFQCFFLRSHLVSYCCPLAFLLLSFGLPFAFLIDFFCFFLLLFLLLLFGLLRFWLFVWIHFALIWGVILVSFWVSFWGHVGVMLGPFWCICEVSEKIAF